MVEIHSPRPILAPAVVSAVLSDHAERREVTNSMRGVPTFDRLAGGRSSVANHEN